MRPKISIVTPSYNQGRFLEETILSVLNQRYEPLEYIIIDGGSSDESVEIIRRYEKHLAFWVTEKDRGQVHALNKGFERITGNIAGFINSDDVYLPGAFNAVVDHFEARPACEWLCADTVLFGQGYPTKLVIANVPKSAAHALSWAYRAPQPGMFWRSELIQCGFQEPWPYDFDHDLYVRLLLDGHACEHVPLPIAGYRLHEASKTVAEKHRQIAEFEQSAQFYEPRLRGADRRWCRATGYLRKAYAASTAGNKPDAARWLLRALVTYPEGLAGRPFWGCARRLFNGPTSEPF
jgi:glycosyltransferase involved in cell wall biosynthesis